jgi:CheY-like chemotaxis protein
MSKRILVIEPSKTLQVVLSHCFKGHQFILCGTPGEALQMLPTLRVAPDLVFLAIDQKKEAYEVVEYLKVHGGYSRTSLVAMVLPEEKAGIQRTLNGTHVSFLIKPFRIEEVLALALASLPGASAAEIRAMEKEGKT